ncbi:MAG TPA: hypothetical protein VKA84_20250 [Gemmatimonadaceae bacterium]|nr:hypothetical protein [Gemmatimonadaceae bacterium]
MDPVDLHLRINHFPIILSIVGAAAAVLAMITRRRAVWLYATATLALAGLTVYPALWTGHRAEDAVEDTWYITRRAIHEHEERGELAMYVMLATGALAAYAWWRAIRVPTRDETTPAWLRAAVLLGGLASAGTLVLASYEGGLIVHHAEGLMVAPAGTTRDAPLPPPVPRP